LYDSCQKKKNSDIFLHTIIQLVVITRNQGVCCAVAKGLLLQNVSGYVRCCQAPSLRALNQVPAGRLAPTISHLPLPAVALFQTMASSSTTSAVVYWHQDRCLSGYPILPPIHSSLIRGLNKQTKIIRSCTVYHPTMTIERQSGY
jgi:hypothetical protein